MFSDSFHYLLFLPVVYSIYSLAGERGRLAVLVAASLLFYGSFNAPYLVAVLLLLVICTFGLGIWIEETETEKGKVTLLWCGILAAVSVLCLIKYLPSVSPAFSSFLLRFRFHNEAQPQGAVLALGVSYYVLQSISYLFDVCLGVEKAERHPGYFTLYMAFFPKLLQGPIERAGDLIPQLRRNSAFCYDNARLGTVMLCWGVLKKTVIADRLALFVDHVFQNPALFKGIPLLLATYAYSFQIYMDFSGYTDIALGSSLLFNIRLTQNFNSPFLATSIPDFWRRWHISFSRWILDYIFKVLQMQWRHWRSWGTVSALMVTFLISGLWHGATWGFVVWGALHGVYMSCSVLFSPLQKKLHKLYHLEKTGILKLINLIVTFNLVSFAWIFFRAATLIDAVTIVKNLFVFDTFYTMGDLGIAEFVRTCVFPGQTTANICVLVVFLPLVSYLGDRIHLVLEKPAAIRILVYNALVFSILLFQVRSSGFIYFKF